MKLKSISGLAALVMIATSVAAPALAEVIFADHFNRADSNFIGRDWLETNNQVNDVAIVDGQLRLRDFGPNARVLQRVSTLGFEHIVLRFTWTSLSASDSDDRLIFSTSDGITRLTRDRFFLGDQIIHSETIELSPDADNRSVLDLIFRIRVDAQNEGVLIDDVVLRGQRIASAIPEPSTWVMMVLGFAGAGFVGYRRKQKSTPAAATA